MDQLPRPPDLIDFDGCGDARADAQRARYSEDLGFLDLGNRVVTSTRMAYRAQVNGEAACRELARALVAAAERRGLLFVEKVRTLQMMRDRPFSQEVCATGTRRSPKRPRRRRTGNLVLFLLLKNC